MPPLQLLPMPQRMLVEQEEDFWHGWDLAMGEELELGCPPPNYPARRGWGSRFLGGRQWSRPRKARPWLLLGRGRWRWMVPSRHQRMVPQRERPRTRRLTPCFSSPEGDGCGLARCCCGGLVSCWRACRGWVDLCCSAQTDQTD